MIDIPTPTPVSVSDQTASLVQLPSSGEALSGTALPPTAFPSTAFRSFDLSAARRNASRLQPAAHQNEALDALDAWFEAAPNLATPAALDLAPRGGLVALPTGAGKTFVAARFLCQRAISQGYKVLWLAPTQDLLNQANKSFAPLEDALAAEHGLEVGHIGQLHQKFNIRVVSGADGHCRTADIRPSDNVLIATLQTMMHAVPKRGSKPGLDAWLGSAEKLVVVFDEAHHAPAPSYRNLVKTLRQSHPGMLLLGLTATPTYGRKNLRGWLGQLFPQGILSQVSAKRLMLDGVLAQPIFEVHDTDIVPDWDESEFEKWRGSFRDLPEALVDRLALDNERNTKIADTYASDREKYGQTIMFAERWFQCDQICEALQKRGVRAGTVYSYVGGGPETADLKSGERTRRRKEANARALEDFRRGDLDVLVNVQMLTEGTDVPGVQSVFLCNQTLSPIFLAQKVGRALRGPKFGGTETAYIVAFHDDWKQPIPWADYELEGIDPVDNASRPAVRPPLQQISIEMVRQLARATDQGLNGTRGEFLSLVPVGWYAVAFEAAAARDASFGAEPTDEAREAEETPLETVRDLVLVYDRDREAYTEFLAHLQTLDLQDFESEEVFFQDALPKLQAWHSEFFSSDSTAKARAQVEENMHNLLRLVRHVAQRQGSGEEVVEPPFFPFEQRSLHDLDALARGFIASDLGPASKMGALHREFERTDCLWNMIYPTLSAFKSQYDASENRILMGALGTIGSIAALEAVPADALDTGTLETLALDTAPEATTPEAPAEPVAEAFEEPEFAPEFAEAVTEPEFEETVAEPGFASETAEREFVEQYL